MPGPTAVALARAAEEHGFDGVWIADSQSTSREVFTLLGACAQETDRVLLATGVTNPVTRALPVLASAMATLNELAPRRAVLGIGRGESSLQSLGASQPSLRDFEHAIRELRGLLGGEDTTALEWGPQAVPVYITVSGPKALRMAGRIGDGVLFQVGAHPDLIAYALRHVEAGALEAGRTLDDLTLCARVACAIGTDSRSAKASIQDYLKVAVDTIRHAIPPGEIPSTAQSEAALADAAAIVGTEEVVVNRLREIADFGISRIVVPLLSSDVEQIRRFGASVLPRLNQGSEF
jgi:5,10-methylenetetrahydromethanopterin reductase